MVTEQMCEKQMHNSNRNPKRHEHNISGICNLLLRKVSYFALAREVSYSALCFFVYFFPRKVLDSEVERILTTHFCLCGLGDTVHSLTLLSHYHLNFCPPNGPLTPTADPTQMLFHVLPTVPAPISQRCVFLLIFHTNLDENNLPPKEAEAHFTCSSHARWLDSN